MMAMSTVIALRGASAMPGTMAAQHAQISSTNCLKEKPCRR